MQNTIKKCLSLLLACLMIMSVATVAFADGGTLTVGTGSGKAGEDVVIPVTLNADGVTSGVFKISYNTDVLTYKSATTATFDANSAVDGEAAGTVKFAFANKETAVAANTALITVTFTVKDGAAVGASTVTAVLEAADAEHHLQADGFLDANGEAVAVSLIAGSVTVEEAAPAFARGDVNGDGQVNSADAIYLLNYTLNESSYPLIGDDDADVNGDGQVNSADAIYLLNYTLNPASYPLA